MYYLKLFDETILTFDMKTVLGLEISNINMISKELEKFPIILRNEINEKTLKQFLELRRIPKNRGFVYEILNTVGLNINDTKGIIDICKGLSLNDCYWIVQDENLQFKNYNLYDNEFSETLSLVAFTGYSSKVKGIIISPELTTNGMLPKAWRRKNDEIYLYKGSTEKYQVSNSGYEPYSEFYSSQVAEKMGINHVKYSIARWKGDLVSICKIFTSKETGYIPIYYAIPNIDLKETATFMKENGYFEDFSNMILFDSVIMNYDRHFGNFGLLIDNHTGKYRGLSPIFDNGEGLLSKANTKIFENKQKFEEFIMSDAENISNYGVSYDRLVENFCDKSHIELLRKLLKFKFEKNNQYDLLDNRLKLLEVMIQKRAAHFIEIIEDKYRRFGEKVENVDDIEEQDEPEEIN